MTTLREAAQKALEALEDMLGWESLAPQSVQDSSKQSLQRLREALAQPDPEPVAIVVAAEYEDGSHAGHRLEWRGRNEANDYPEGTEFYTAPPPQRQPLTDEELVDIVGNCAADSGGWFRYHAFARAIERAHGIGSEE